MGLGEFVDADEVIGGFVAEDDDAGAVGDHVAFGDGAGGKWVGGAGADLLDVGPEGSVALDGGDGEGVVFNVLGEDDNGCFGWGVVGEVDDAEDEAELEPFKGFYGPVECASE